MKYPLEDLLRVRRFREDTAASELTKRRREVEDAEVLVARRKQELADYIKWRVTREEELYQEVLERQVQLQDLDDLKQKIRLLREKELDYEDKIQAAERKLADARAALESALGAYHAAVKDREKIDEHKELWAQEAAREFESNQEKELEDFRVRSLDTEEVDDG